MADKVLVTGASGFIGSHVVEALIDQGLNVRGLLHYRGEQSMGFVKHLEQNSQFETISGDIRDEDSMLQAVEGCDSVIHLAALISVHYSFSCPESYIDTNVRGTLNILKAAQKNELKKIVLTSTSEVYGSAQKIPITEEHPLCAQSPYAASKTAADQLALSFHKGFDLPIVIVRPFNTFGPRQSPRAVIANVIMQCLKSSEPLKLGNVTTTRDFTFVRDTAQGFLAALRSSENAYGEVFNLGTGFEISINDLIQEIAKLTGREALFEEDDARIRPGTSEVTRLCSSHEKAKTLLGWEPQYANLEGLREALALSIEWYKENAEVEAFNPYRNTK
jgi:dTDP-glucose 4,6-dehydratase